MKLRPAPPPPPRPALSPPPAKLANPFSLMNTLMKRHAPYEGTGNLLGEGFVHGGLYVVRAGARAGDAPAFAYAEQEIGEHAPVDDVLAAAKAAAAEPAPAPTAKVVG